MRPRPWGVRSRLAALAILILGGVYASRHLDVRQAWASIDALGVWAPLAFCVAYAVAAASMVPGTLLTLAAGAKWGPVEGLIYVILGSNLGANLAFGLGRSLARGWVARRVAQRPRFAAVERAVAEEGWKVVALLRLSPVFPYNVLNYALSLTAVRWPAYALATFAGMLPGTVLFVYLGSLVQVATRPQTRTPWEWGLFALGLAATLAATVLITRAARRALAQRWDNHPE
ncbi:MAG: TVP38/TMEM64 family protein [Verrucomicrobiales bacterium]